MTVPHVHQAVVGDHNIFTGAGDIKVVYELTSSNAGERRNLLVLLERVKRFWIKDVFEGSVRPAALLLLSKTTVPNAVEHPWKTALGTAEHVCKEIPADKNISDVFDEMGRLLLILGEPGSGKTTTLLELTSNLVESAFADPIKPIPVVCHLSSWSEKRQSIFDWLVEELRTKYYIPPHLGRSFLAYNRLLLLLDGLDEVYPAYQSACVEAINRFARDVGTPGLVVSCRYNEYRELPQRLAFNGAVYLQPLSFEQIDRHLAEHGDSLASLRTVLREDVVLQHLAGTPLMLDVMVSAYQDLPVEVLRDESLQTPKARRANIFQTYVVRMFDRRSQNSRPFSREKLMHWMSLLAKNMTLHAQSIFLIERIQPTWLSSRRQLFAYLLSSRVVAGWVIVSPYMVFYLLQSTPPIGERIGYTFCVLLFTFTMGLFAALLKLRQSKKRNEAQTPPAVASRFRIGVQMLAYLVVGGILASPITAIAGWIWLIRTRATLTPGPHSIGLEGLWFATITACPTPTFSSEAQLAVFMVLLTLAGVVLGAGYGLVFGLFIGLRDKKRYLRDDIQTAERIGWSGIHAKKAAKRVLLWLLLISSFIGTIAFPFILLVILYLSVTRVGKFGHFISGFGLASLLSLYVSAVLLLVLFLLFGPIGSLLGGLTAGTIETTQLTNRGIRNSLKKSIYAGIIVGGFVALLNLVLTLISYRFNRLIGSTYGVQQLVVSDLLQGYLVGWLTLGMMGALWYGGMDLIKHYSLRLVLYLNGNGPRRFDTFLDYAVKLGFMYRIGGGYIFIHSLLRDYFVELFATKKQT
jgi:hypothetical protein